jgi:periplasmic divalent cation tolerance protein
MTDVRVVLVTVPPGDLATGLANSLVGERLAACVNVIPGLRSIYRWEGQVCDESESLLVIKTVQDRLDQLVARVRQLHPYALPEVLVLPVDAGSIPYMDWVLAETRPFLP